MARQPSHCIGSSCHVPSLSTHKAPHPHKLYRNSLIVRVQAAADDSTKQRTGWSLPWPFKPSAADEHESEYEIVYVTDHGTEDVEQEPHAPTALEAAQEQPQEGLAAVAAEPAVAEDSAQLLQAAVDAAEILDSEQAATAAIPEASATGTAAAAAIDRSIHPNQPFILVPAAAPASSSLHPAAATGGLASFLESNAGGWVVAAALLLAVREGRARADADRLDVRALQARQENSRVQSRELREKRAQYLQQQQALKEAQAAKRLSDAARRAEVERQEAAARAAEYERAALEELEALRARRAAAKKAFEESASRLDDELRARTARELALREEELARREAQQQAQRAAAAAEAARLEAEAQRAAEAAERAAREALERRLAEKKQARQQSIRLQVQIAGQVIAAPVKAGSSSSSGGGKQLSVSIQLYPGGGSSSSRDGGNDTGRPKVGSSSRTFESSDAAVDSATALAAAAAEQAVQHYAVTVQQLPAAAAAAGQPSSSNQLDGLQITQPSNQQQQQQQQGSVTTAAASSSSLSDADVDLWRMLLFLKVESAARLAVCQVAPLAGGTELTQDFKVLQRFCSLPAQHPSGLQQQLAAAADLTGQNNMTGALQILTDIIEWQLEDFIVSKPSDSFILSSSSGNGVVGSSSSSSSLRELVDQASTAAASTGIGSSMAAICMVPACVFAALLNAADPDTIAYNNQRSSSSSPDKQAETSRSSSPDNQAGSSSSNTPLDTAADDDMFDAVPDSAAAGSQAGSSSSRRSLVGSSDSALQRLVKFQLEDITRAAPQDSLAPLAAALQFLLGRQHPVAAAMTILADRNTSVATRQAREMRRQQQQLAKATQLLKGSTGGVLGPGGLDPQGARLRQDLVPVPERTWALRNVANNMLRTAAADSAAAEEALGMLRQAAELAAQHYGKTHPGQLSALLDHISALLKVPGHAQEAASAIEAACNIVAAVGDRYRQQQDLLSLVLLYESTQAELDVPQILGRENVAMVRLQRQAADAFSVLDTAQANLVMSKRKVPPGSPSTALRQLARDCTEELGVYTSSRKRVTRLEQWNKGLPLAPLR